MELDDIDWAILEDLQVDGRVAFRELGRRVGLSAPAVAARVRRLEDRGIITGYKAVHDLEHLGVDVLAFVRVSVGGGKQGIYEQVIETARSIPEVIDLYTVSGAETFLLKVAMRSVGDLERVLRPMWQFGDTITGVVMSEPIADRPIVREMVERDDPAPKRRR